jgi:hypothetical protein
MKVEGNKTRMALEYAAYHWRCLEAGVKPLTYPQWERTKPWAVGGGKPGEGSLEGDVPRGTSSGVEGEV